MVYRYIIWLISWWSADDCSLERWVAWVTRILLVKHVPKRSNFTPASRDDHPGKSYPYLKDFCRGFGNNINPIRKCYWDLVLKGNHSIKRLLLKPLPVKYLFVIGIFSEKHLPGLGNARIRPGTLALWSLLKHQPVCVCLSLPSLPCTRCHKLKETPRAAHQPSAHRGRERVNSIQLATVTTSADWRFR